MQPLPPTEHFTRSFQSLQHPNPTITYLRRTHTSTTPHPATPEGSGIRSQLRWRSVLQRRRRNRRTQTPSSLFRSRTLSTTNLLELIRRRWASKRSRYHLTTFTTSEQLGLDSSVPLTQIHGEDWGFRSSAAIADGERAGVIYDVQRTERGYYGLGIWQGVRALTDGVDVYWRFGEYSSLRLHLDSVLTQSLHTASRTSSVSTFSFVPGRSCWCPIHQCGYSRLLHLPRVIIRRQLLCSGRHCYEQHRIWSRHRMRRMVSFKIQLGRPTDIYCTSLILLLCLF